MAEILFVTPLEVKQKTIVDGNVDAEKINYAIFNVMIRDIEPLLGSELFDKIKTDLEASTLTGLYETLYNEFVKPITLYKATAEYIEISNYMVKNGGTFKHQGENAEVVDKDELLTLSNKYNSNAQVYINRFYKWICKNTITEYKTLQDEVNARKGVNTVAGWFFGGNNSGDCCDDFTSGSGGVDGNFI